MTFNRFRRRVDLTPTGDSLQVEVKRAVVAAGYGWQDLFRVGEGFPDGIAAVDWLNILVEIKRPGEMLNERENEFWNEWPGLEIIAFGGQDAVNKLSELRRRYVDRRRVK